MTKRLVRRAALAVLTFALFQIQAIAGPPSDDATNIQVAQTRPIDEIRPRVTGCPCNIRAMALWAGWDKPSCETNLDSEFVASQQLYSNDDILPYVEVVGQVFGLNNFYGLCDTFNDNNVVIQNIGITFQEYQRCAIDIHALALDLGIPGGCPEPLD